MARFCVEIELYEDHPIFVDYGIAEPGALAQAHTEYSFFDEEKLAARMFLDTIKNHPEIRHNQHTLIRASEVV